MHKIPFFRYPHVFNHESKAIREAMLSAASSGAFIMQHDLRAFEEELAEYCGVRYAIGIGNATDGLEFNLRIATVGPGDEVLLPSHTFVATASAIVALGAKPVFVEIGPDHLIDPDDIEHRITKRARAVMPAQLNGRTAEMDRICAIAEKHGIAVVEDSAQGLGSRFKGKMAGTFGPGGVFSFYPAKTLGCLGDGGAVITDDESVAQTIRELRDHGRNETTGEIVRWGRNSRLDNLQAAVLRVKLAKLEDAIATRRSLARRYHAALRDVPELVLPPPPNLDDETDHYDVFQNYELEAEDRDRLIEHLANRGVGTMLQWGGRGVHQFPALGFRQSLPRTESIMARSLMLPMNTSLSVDEVDYVCDTVRGFYGS